MEIVSTASSDIDSGMLLCQVILSFLNLFVDLLPILAIGFFIYFVKNNHSNNLEVVRTGYANGVAEGYPLSSEDKQEMIRKASHAFGLFLDALKCDWKNDPNSCDTPNRVAKAYVNDLWAGRYNEMSPITF